MYKTNFNKQHRQHVFPNVTTPNEIPMGKKKHLFRYHSIMMITSKGKASTR